MHATVVAFLFLAVLSTSSLASPLRLSQLPTPLQNHNFVTEDHAWLSEARMAASLNAEDRQGDESYVRKQDQSSVSVIANDQIRLGIDTSMGCSVVLLEAVHDGVNVINSYDKGREIQPSFYSGPADYDNCTWNGQEWPWNPIGSGDAFGNPSSLISHTNDGKTISCTVKPMQWACNNVPCECTFELSYSLQGTAVKAQITLHNSRADKQDYGAYPQELPAAYTNGFMYRLFAYTGNSPWTDGPLTEFQPSFDGKTWQPGAMTTMEPWIGFTNKDMSFMIALYSSESDGSFLGGFAGKKGSGGEHDSPTGYMAATRRVDIPPSDVYSYKFAVVIGSVPTVRQTLLDLHNQGW